jgi:hypothetical protein
VDFKPLGYSRTIPEIENYSDLAYNYNCTVVYTTIVRTRAIILDSSTEYQLLILAHVCNTRSVLMHTSYSTIVPGTPTKRQTVHGVIEGLVRSSIR